MQVGKLGLQIYQRPICARNVARSARARTHRTRRGAHRFDYLGMLAHAEVVVRAPDDDIPLAARAVPVRMRELSRLALQVGEDAITALTFQGINRRLKASFIVEHCWESFRDGTHSAGVWAVLSGSPATTRSCVSRVTPMCTMAATMAPTIGAVTYSQASLKLPGATIGPSARAGLKAAPVRAPPMMMLRVSVIPIASGARLPARPATAVLSTTVTRKKASTASITKPAAGVTVMVVAPRARPCASAGTPRPVAAPPSTADKRSAPRTPPTSWLTM